MALDAEAVQKLIDQLAQDRQAFIESTNKTHELLQQTLKTLQSISKQRPTLSVPVQTPQPPPPLLSVLTTPIATQRRGSLFAPPTITKASQRTTTAGIDVESVPKDKPLSEFEAESDTDSDDNDSVFVQTPLQPEEYDMEGLRNHIWDHSWTEGGKAIIDDLHEDDEALGRDCLLPLTKAEAEADRSHLAHYSIYDVGFDGTPLDVRHTGKHSPTRAMQIWNRIRTTNNDPSKQPAAGRIIIVREPSPKLFAALHYTMNKHFDMDEIYDLLKHEDPGLMFPHRAFDTDTRHRRTFIVTMEYFTIIGEMCRPMKWQRSHEDETGHVENHIPITRCSSVIALSLEGPPLTKVKNRDRRIQDRFGDVFDPFSPWRVLSIQAYPDWHATTDTHKSSMHYVNGPEAFLYTIEAEFADARKRLKEVHNRVGELVEPPPNFIFNSKVREKLLFEDDKFTYSKKYFWAYQTLSIINQDITEMIESYRDTFRDSVWDGTNKIIWPGEASISSRYQQWRKRMAKLRTSMDEEVASLEYIKELNNKKMQDIEALRENLFSGTSVMESRRSVEQTLVTIEQNRSVLLLTLVTIFFLPLTFVTSVFGMTNMDPTESYFHFAWTVIAICLPTYLLIGSLHTDTGLKFWRDKTHAVFSKLGLWIAQFLALFGYRPRWTRPPTDDQDHEDEDVPKKPMAQRANSATRTAMHLRMRQGTEGPMSPTLSRFSTQEKITPVIPRPQLTSGDASELEAAVGSKVRTKSNEVTFSIDQSLRTHSFAVKQGSPESASPRTGSPGRTDDGWEGGNRRGSKAPVAQRKARMLLGRLWRRQETPESLTPPDRRPSV